MRIYIFATVLVVIFLSYAAGRRIGRLVCRNDNIVTETVVQNQTIKTIGEINAETYTTAVADIRRVLREKYTIAE